MAIFAPLTEKECWENNSNIWLLTFLCLDSTQSQCFQSTDNLPKCNSANLEQSLQEARTSGRERSRALKDISLWKERGCFIFLKHLFPSMWNLLKGTRFYFQPFIYANSLIQLLGLMSIFKQFSLTMILSACSTSFLKVVIGQAWIPLLNFVILKESSDFLAAARIYLMHLSKLLLLQLLNCLFFHCACRLRIILVWSVHFAPNNLNNNLCWKKKVCYI